MDVLPNASINVLRRAYWITGEFPLFLQHHHLRNIVMVIEWLKIHVPAAKQDAYLFHDMAIWSQTLSRYPGYIGKTVWHEPAEPDYLVLIISWHSLRQWKAVPQDVLDATDARMLAAMGEVFEIVEGKHFDTVN